MLIKIDIDMPKSLASFGTSSFEDVFVDELIQNEQKLPLGRFCTYGGWPDPDTLEVDIKSMAEKNGQVSVEVQCFFTEVVPTGCADIQEHATGEGVIDVVLEIESGRCYVPLDSDNL